MSADRVAAGESLGRRDFSRTRAERARRRGRVVPHVFLSGSAQISVDRLSVAPPGEITKLAQEASRNRPSPFQGWAVVACGSAHDSDRQVVSSPQADNPYHCDIRLPTLAEHNRDEQVRHAQELAAASSWREPAA